MVLFIIFYSCVMRVYSVGGVSLVVLALLGHDMMWIRDPSDIPCSADVES